MCLLSLYMYVLTTTTTTTNIPRPRQQRCEQSFKIFEAAPQDQRGVPAKHPTPDYFL